MTPEEAYFLACNNGPSMEIEDAISTDGWYSYHYACHILKAPFRLGEPKIAEYLDLSYLYACNVLRGRFYHAEPKISSNIQLSYLYAKDILKSPFFLGEPSICMNLDFS